MVAERIAVGIMRPAGVEYVAVLGAADMDVRVGARIGDRRGIDEKVERRNAGRAGGAGIVGYASAAP